MPEFSAHHRYRASPALLAVLVAAAALLYLAFRTGINFSANWIWNSPEYSHGLLIPFIAAFLVWQRKDRLANIPFTGTWAGVALLLFAISLNIAGELGSLFTVQQYAAVLALYGLVLALVGWEAIRVVWMPLLILLFMIPLPEFIYNNLSASLQLISSSIGVKVIRLFAIPVYLEGNVIDLGAYKLQVAEACSGLRYLFPLMTLGFVMAYFFQVAFWKRALLFLSSIPITVLMNSFRIGVIGVLVAHYGIRQAEGFLHDFEGWVIFMASTAVMLVEIIVLSKLGSDARPWREIFGIDIPASSNERSAITPRPIPTAVWAASALLAIATVGVYLMPQRSDSIPVRRTFTEFPMMVAGLSGRAEPLEQQYLDVLKLDDYLMANYAGDGKPPVNFYVAWYDTQRAGRSAHSPRSCLPGGGWQIQSLDKVSVPDVRIAGHSVTVNRALIQFGESRQLVYYFFKQRDRILTNEYVVKWYLMWDALTKQRTDGALVRLVVPLAASDSPELGDARLKSFLASAAPQLAEFVPN